MARRSKSDSGFTLIELLVVIIILGILAAVVVFAVSGVGDKGKSSAITIDARTLRTAEEAYCAKNGKYADGATLIAGGFLSDQPQYHQVFARQGTGTCNGWQYSIMRTAQAAPGQWATTNPPPNDMTPVFLVRLADGRVLVGGVNVDFDGAAAAIWDPVTTNWTTVDAFSGGVARITPSAMLLVDDPGTPTSECALGAVNNCGKVLYREKFLFDPQAAPGSQWQTLTPPAGCYICNTSSFAYDPRNMVQIRGLPSMCGTACGKILMSGGSTGGGTRNALLYDPKNNFYELVSYSGVDRLERHTHLNQLLDGRVLFCCGGPDGPGPIVPKADFFDPITRTFSAAPAPPRVYDRGTGSGFGFNAGVNPEPTPVLPNGEFFFGREDGSGNGAFPPGLQTAGVYTPQAGGPGVWNPTVSSCSSTDVCNIIGSLPDGRVLARDGLTATTYAYNPATQLWDSAASINNPDSLASVGDAVLLDPAGGPCGSNCGKIFVAGFLNAELFTP